VLHNTTASMNYIKVGKNVIVLILFLVHDSWSWLSLGICSLSFSPWGKWKKAIVRQRTF